MTDMVNRGQSPFDALKHVDQRGEYWYGRELMPPAGYADWRNFQRAINEARSAMAQEGYDLSDHFALVSLPQNPDQQERRRGRPANTTDWRLSRMACHFVFMNGDPHKPEIAAAQNYFILQTQRMEAVQATIPQQMPTLPQALRAWADEVEAREKAELQAAEAKAEAEMLRPPAEAWQTLVDTGQDYSMAEAAAILNRDPAIDTGQNRLRDWMIGNRMMYRRGKGQLVPYSEHLIHIRLKPQSRPNYDAEDPRARKEANSQVRITVRGLEWIQQRMRDQTRPALIPAQRVPEEIEPPINFDQYRTDRYQALKALQRR